MRKDVSVVGTARSLVERCYQGIRRGRSKLSEMLRQGFYSFRPEHVDTGRGFNGSVDGTTKRCILNYWYCDCPDCPVVAIANAFCRFVFVCRYITEHMCCSAKRQ